MTRVSNLTVKLRLLEKSIDDTLHELSMTLGDNIRRQAQNLSVRYPRRKVRVYYINGTFAVEVESWPKPVPWNHRWGVFIDFRGDYDITAPTRLKPFLEAMTTEWLETRELIEHRVYPMIDYPITYLAGETYENQG